MPHLAQTSATRILSGTPVTRSRAETATDTAESGAETDDLLYQRFGAFVVAVASTVALLALLGLLGSPYGWLALAVFIVAFLLLGHAGSETLPGQVDPPALALPGLVVARIRRRP